MYDKIEEAENNLMDARAKKQAIEADKITGDNIYKVLICFEKLYNVMNSLERKKLMEHLISEIQIYPERQPNGQWLKSIKFRLPIVEAGRFCFTLPDRTSGKAPQCTETYIPDTVRCHRGNAVQPVLSRCCTTSQRPDSGVEIPGT